MMNLIDKQDRFFPGGATAIGGRGHHPAHFCNIALHPAKPLKFRLRQCGDDLGECRLARAGRSGKDDRGKPVRLDRAPQQFARREDMLLSHELVERPRTHPTGERRRSVGLRFRFRLVEEVLHVAE
jgi:hypothetical protein